MVIDMPKKDKKKLNISFQDTLDDISKKLDEYFSDEKNRQDFLEYMKEESEKPYNTHLLCNEICCEYNKPEDPDMGTICWCDKYLTGQEELCEKECDKRWWYEPLFGPIKEGEEDEQN